MTLPSSAAVVLLATLWWHSGQHLVLLVSAKPRPDAANSSQDLKDLSQPHPDVSVVEDVSQKTNVSFVSNNSLEVNDISQPHSSTHELRDKSQRGVWFANDSSMTNSSSQANQFRELKNISHSQSSNWELKERSQHRPGAWFNKEDGSLETNSSSSHQNGNSKTNSLFSREYNGSSSEVLINNSSSSGKTGYNSDIVPESDVLQIKPLCGKGHEECGNNDTTVLTEHAQRVNKSVSEFAQKIDTTKNNASDKNILDEMNYVNADFQSNSVSNDTTLKPKVETDSGSTIPIFTKSIIIGETSTITMKTSVTTVTSPPARKEATTEQTSQIKSTSTTTKPKLPPPPPSTKRTLTTERKVLNTMPTHRISAKTSKNLGAKHPGAENYSTKSTDRGKTKKEKNHESHQPTHHLARHFTGFVQHVWLPNSTPRHPGPIEDGPFGSILWKDKKYLVSVLIPIGVGFLGAMMIIVMAYVSRAWRKRKERLAHEHGLPGSFLEAAESKHDDTTPLHESSDEEF